MVSHSTVDYLKAYKAMVLHGLDYWAVPGLRELRDEVDHMLMSNERRQLVARLDGYVVDAITDLDDDEVPAELLEDDVARPLPHWWWRLGALRAGTYPASMLPPYLRAIYQPALKAAA